MSSSKKSLNHWLPSRSFFLASIGVTTFLTLGIVFGSVSPSSVKGPFFFGLTFVALSIAFNLTTLFYAGFTHTMRRGSVSILKDPRSMLASIGTTQGIAAVLSIMGRISTSELVLISTLFQVWGTYLFFQIAADAYLVNRREIRYASTLYTSAVALFALGCFTLRNWFSPTVSLNANLLWQASITGLGLVGTLLWLACRPSLRLSSQSIKESIQLRISGRVHGVTRQSLLTTAGLSWFAATMVWILSNLLRYQFDSDIPIWLATGVAGLFFPALYLSWSELREQAANHAELVVSSRLAGDSALRFLRRNQGDGRAWAAAVGVRTTVFTIDHDPDNQIAASLPATLNQIRCEEISRCINEVLNQKMMHHHASGQRVFGAMDPEYSDRPCVDLLKLFACLYLDAGPLIERRINGLVALLPIVNPGLARVLKPDLLASMLKRNQWFFHFDYHWVDQHMINTPGSTRYGVHLDPLSADMRQNMVDHLRKANGMGNFLWLGKDAHERLLQEAPMLAPIIEPLTLRYGNDHDSLVFIMKFENLIPRLQRYFDLDFTRNILMDFEPSHESAKLINIFKLQASRATDCGGMLNLVDSLASYPWRGFKEKDQALKIIVLAHQFASQAIATCETEGSVLNKDILKLQSQIQKAVEQIGYPAQILHHAQLQKIALRDIQKLVEAARNPVDTRFEESWVLLSSFDFKRYSAKERDLVMALMQDHIAIAKLLEQKEIHGKFIYAMVNLIKIDGELTRNGIDLNTIFSQLVTAICCKSPSAETLTILLDTMTFISQLSSKEIVMTTAAKQALEAVVQPYENSRSIYASSAWARWSEFRQKSRNVIGKAS